MSPDVHGFERRGSFDAHCDELVAALPQGRVGEKVKLFVRRAQVALHRVQDLSHGSHGEEPLAAQMALAAKAATDAARELRRPVRPSKAAAPRLPTDADAWRVLRDLESVAAPIKLVWIPDFVRQMAKHGGNARWCWNWLHDERKARTLELRPESGVGRLSAADAALCPSDVDGHPLSHVRIFEKRGTR